MGHAGRAGASRSDRGGVCGGLGACGTKAVLGRARCCMLVLHRWSRQWVPSAAAMLRPLTTTMGGALWGVAGVSESPRGQLRSARGGQG